MFFTIRRSGGRFLRGGTSNNSGQQRGPPSWSAKSLRQIRERQPESANQRAPTVGDNLTRSGSW